ncbi:hypothetical protein B0T11DRAFT_292439 [Plectosphaerella cucumerina]|uniref:G domain-containing protein n=1 Tax=Plectosphaerella cucumerina TaxID=40658 RepID=A0A8K0TS02_9PEZI|nr:hypothetical protein B0T11DRAFT_292439 [Plectosphaerella cucumerina]
MTPIFDKYRNGHGQESCTLQVQVYPFFNGQGQTIYLIDTPGFDNTELSDTQVLAIITQWLANAYNAGVSLHGVLYFHSIADRRLRGSAGRNCDMLRALCGPAAPSRTHLVTTMWDSVPIGDAQKREHASIMTPGLWCQLGGRIHRHWNINRSARDILAVFVEGNREPITLAIQDEVINQKKTCLRYTAAGRALGIDPVPVLASTKNYNSQSDAREAQHKVSYEEPIGALGHVMPQQKARELEPPQPQSDASGLGGQVSAEWYKGMSTYAISLSGRIYCYNGKKVYGIGTCYVNLCRNAAGELHIEHSDNLADHYALLADCLRDNADDILNLAQSKARLTLGPTGTY